jgi:hypothetical protein
MDLRVHKVSGRMVTVLLAEVKPDYFLSAARRSKNNLYFINLKSPVFAWFGLPQVL